ncbi:splicing factor, arginine/serine-rich 19 isoform X2 [Pseudorasbora parva]|uniref:splicing factor, arginine/serine-rich 19 isoform X2 n=1 Tax=Pseudorasbora parva TaxID=51549 RepID=UPI00351EE0E3
MKMGTDGQAEKDGEELVPGKSQAEQCPDEEEEVESKADRRTVGLRCFQGNRETSEDEPSELGAAVVTSSEPVFLVPQLSSQPQYLDCDFDVELTAEVKVEDGASLALLTSVTPNLGYQKPGSLLKGLFPAFLRKNTVIDSSLPSGSFPGYCSSVIKASGQMQLPCSFKNSKRVIEMAKSPLPSSPSNSPSSPSSAPSSPSSSPSSSSPGGMGTNYHEDEDRGHAGDSRASKGTGDFVSSTSSSLVPSSMPPSSSNPSLHASSSFAHPCNDGQRESLENDIYDPFHPTEGEGERDRASTEDEEEEVDKYDPFEPTGSPVSETEEENRCMDEGNEGISSINSEENVVKAERALEMGVPAGTEGGPPDSTEIDVPSSMFNNVPLELNNKRSMKDRMREQGKNQRERGTDSELSEIEEGEIVGASERGRERVIERRREVLLPSSSSPSYLQGGVPKPERILRVLEGDGFVSVRADEEWEREPVASVGVGDLRRKLTSRRKERFRSCPSSASISPPPAPVLPLPSPSFPNSPPLSTDKGRSRKSSKSSKDRDRRKRKEGRGEKEKRKKRKEGKESGEEKSESKERDHEKRSEKENKGKDRERGRSSQSDSRKRKKRRRSTPEHSSRSHSQNASRHAHSRRSWSSPSEDHHKDKEREKERERVRERNHERDRDRDRWRDDRDRERDRDSRRRDGRRRDRDEDNRRSSSRERDGTKRRRGSSDRRDKEKEMSRDRDRDRRRDSRPVVPPSIQDLNGSDLFAIKRTITVTTTTTTTTVPSSPPCSQRRSHSRSESSDKHHKRKKKRRHRSDDEERKDEEHRSRSQATSLTPPRYHGYESDHLSDRPELDMLSLDGEALDSDYPSLEDSPLLPPPPPEPCLPSPKIKTGAPKMSRHHLKKKSRPGKTVGNTTSLQPTTFSSTTKRGRKTGKEKLGKKDAGRSGRSKKLSGSSRKGKLQSKVSVLVREGVSSTTGNSGKLGLDLLGPGGVVSGASGPSVVGGSIAVVFRRDNESRSPFLKPCSETLALPGRGKDASKTGKQRHILGPPLSTNPSGLKSKKAKPSSATSTSSSASSPTSSLAAKRRRRPGKKPREKGLTVDGSDSKSANSNCSTVGGGWAGVSTEMQPLVGVGSKPSSPPSALPGPTPSSSSSSSSSSSASILPPSSSPPHTSPLSLPPSRDTRESSPDSQTVDSSCKTPEPSFLLEEGPGQSKASSLTPSKSPASPPSLLSSQIRGDSISQSTSKPLLPDDQKASPPCSTSASSLSASISHSNAPLANDPSSSSSSSVSSSSVNKPPPPPPPPPSAPALPWSLQTGVDCTAGGVLALTALLFKMEEANIANRAKAQEFIQATSQILSQANQNQSQSHPSSSSSSISSQVPPPPSHAPPPGPTPAQFILHSSVPLVGSTKTPPSHLHPGLSMGGGCAQTPPPPLPAGMTGPTGGSEMGWDNESKDPDKYLKKLHTQERAVEEVKLAIKPYYQRKDINKDEYKDILRKAVHKICHSRTGEINPVKVNNLVKLYVQRYKYFRKHGRKMDEEEKEDRESA